MPTRSPGSRAIRSRRPWGAGPRSPRIWRTPTPTARSSRPACARFGARPAGRPRWRRSKSMRWSSSPPSTGSIPTPGPPGVARATVLGSRDETVPWPPGRNEPCWWGSGASTSAAATEGHRAPDSRLGHLLLIGVFEDPVLQDPHAVRPLALGKAAHGAARLASRRHMRARWAPPVARRRALSIAWRSRSVRSPDSMPSRSPAGG